MKKISLLLGVALLLVFCSEAAFAWPFGRHRRTGEENAQRLMAKMKEADPDMQQIFDKAVGWAVFPRISKAGVGIGGAGGNGRVYRKGVFIGTTTMSQVSVGFQLGGQVFGEVIFFQDDDTLNRYKEGHFEIGANASAILFDAGVARAADFQGGTMVFIIPDKGLMYEATISGQKFTFKAKK